MTLPSEKELLARLAEIPEPPSRHARSPARPTASALAPSRAPTRRRRLIALIASVAWVGVTFAVFGLRPDFGALPLAYVEAQVVAPYLLAVTCLAVALASGRLGLGASLGPLALVALLAPSSFLLTGAALPVPHEPATGSSSLVGAFVCLDITVAWSVVPLVFGAIALRGAFPAASIWRSALVGAAAGLFAGATINLHCPNVAHFHLLVGHGLPVIAAALIGAFALSRFSRT